MARIDEKEAADLSGATAPFNAHNRPAAALRR
jgi:hypothetical protein